MEKFEVYSFGDVFYTEEEIKEMGLSHLNFFELKENLSEKDKNAYDITTHSSMTSNVCSLEEYLESYDNEKTVFFQDRGNHGICVDFDTFYGIRYDTEHVILLRSKCDRDREYEKLEEKILNQLNGILMKNQSLEYYNEQFKQQEEVKRKQKKLREIVRED